MSLECSYYTICNGDQIRTPAYLKSLSIFSWTPRSLGIGTYHCQWLSCSQKMICMRYYYLFSALVKKLNGDQIPQLISYLFRSFIAGLHEAWVLEHITANGTAGVKK